MIKHMPITFKPLDKAVLSFPKTIYCLTSRYDVKLDPDSFGASFDGDECQLKIGTKNIDKNPEYVLNSINHELFEMAALELGYRHNDPNGHQFIFAMTHKEFTNVIQLFTQLQIQFLCSGENEKS